MLAIMTKQSMCNSPSLHQVAEVCRELVTARVDVIKQASMKPSKMAGGDAGSQLTSNCTITAAWTWQGSISSKQWHMAAEEVGKRVCQHGVQIVQSGCLTAKFCSGTIAARGSRIFAAPTCGNPLHPGPYTLRLMNAALVLVPAGQARPERNTWQDWMGEGLGKGQVGK